MTPSVDTLTIISDCNSEIFRNFWMFAVNAVIHWDLSLQTYPIKSVQKLLQTIVQILVEII